MLPHADRIHALDAVRALALLLGIVLHAAMPYVHDFPNWTIVETPSGVLTAVWYVVHMFRMPVFFLIAGFFGRMMLQRLGTRSFLEDRAKRILVPLVFGLPVVVITILFAYELGALATGERVSVEAGHDTDLAHLWFLYYLAMFYGAALIVRALLGRFASSADVVVRFLMRGFRAPLLLAAPMVAYFQRNEEWPSWVGLPSPGSFVPSMDALFGYGMIFGFGWLLQRQPELLHGLAKSWPVYLAAAFALVLVCRAIGGSIPKWEPYLTGRSLWIYTSAYMLAVWCWSFGLIGAALRFLAAASPVLRYLADSSYWLYLMHFAPIVFFSALFHPLSWHWSVKYFLTIAATIPLLLVSYHYFVRFTWVGAILNGRRHARVRAGVPQIAVVTESVS